MHAGPELEQPEHPPAGRDLTLRGLDRSGEQLENRAFARSVWPDDAERLTGRHGETHAVEGPELLMLHGATSEHGERHALKGAGRLMADDKPLADIAELDRGQLLVRHDALQLLGIAVGESSKDPPAEPERHHSHHEGGNGVANWERTQT